MQGTTLHSLPYLSEHAHPGLIDVGLFGYDSRTTGSKNKIYSVWTLSGTKPASCTESSLSPDSFSQETKRNPNLCSSTCQPASTSTKTHIDELKRDQCMAITISRPLCV